MQRLGLGPSVLSLHIVVPRLGWKTLEVRQMSTQKFKNESVEESVVTIKSAVKVSQEMMNIGVSLKEPQSTLAPVRTGQKGKECACANCGTLSHCRKREFSVKAWTALLIWNEISVQSVNRPICNDCYQEMREILIDRSDEIEEVLSNHNDVAKVQEFLSVDETGLAS